MKKIHIMVNILFIIGCSKNLLKNTIKYLARFGYRYHWSKNNKIKSDEISKIVKKDNFENFILKKIPDVWNNYDVILGEKMYVNNWKFSKIFKHAKLKFIKNPRYFLKSNQNIKLHFDVFFGEGFMNKAIELLDDKEKDDFKNFVNFQHGFHEKIKIKGTYG